MAFTINAVGNALTPFDSFLLLRGTKTLAIRMDRQQSTAMLVAQMLQRLGFVTHYPGLPNHPGKEVHERIAEGMSLNTPQTFLNLGQDTELFCHSRPVIKSSVNALWALLASGVSVLASVVSIV